MSDTAAHAAPAIVGLAEPAPTAMETQRLAAISIAGLAVLGGVAPLAPGLAWWQSGWPALALALAAALAALLSALRGGAAATAVGGAVTLLLSAALVGVAHGAAAGRVGVGFFPVLLAAWVAVWSLIQRFTDLAPAAALARRLVDAATPLAFGGLLFLTWEVVTVGCGVPMVLLPAPSQIAVRFATSLPILGEDFVQTVLRAVIPGWAIGSALGFAVALLADRHPFLGRGLIPLGDFVSALPMVGIAPIMVMWFGFDWQSKVAVVVVNTFFPALVNTVAGLAASGRMERDLMRSWNASWFRTLISLRLPAAMPHVFSALKLNSTFALIGAIVAEFFGTPIVGMGFRISTEVGRMGLDMVWAEIAMAAITGSALYALLAFVERRVTFWHPSNRER
jgi:NitT/TauT family transport system permease protein